MFLFSQKFRWSLQESSVYSHIVYVIRTLGSFPFLFVPLCFSPPSCSSKNPGTGLSEWTEWTPGLVPDFSGSALDFSPFPVMLAIVFWYTTYAMLRYVLFICRVYRAFCIKRAWVLPKVFSVCIWITCDLSPSDSLQF